MKMYFANSLPMSLRSKVYHKWINRYETTAFQDEAHIVHCGINPINALYYEKAKYFVCPATNTDHITNLKSNQKVVSIKGASELLEGVYSTAEHTMTLMCMLARKVFEKPGFWNRYDFTGTTLRGKTLAIIGYGRVGKQLERIARDGFGMIVLPYDNRTETNWEKSEVLQEADFISINVSVTPDSPKVLRRDDFAHIKQGAFLVNTSRGKAIDEQFIIDNHKHFGGIALDVLEGEPNPPNFNKLRKLPNVILTPHISGCTIDDMTLTSDYCLTIMEGIEQHDKTSESQYHC
jgi:D-3-phosphoglycerate dehydrogenase